MRPHARPRWCPGRGAGILTVVRRRGVAAAFLLFIVSVAPCAFADTDTEDQGDRKIRDTVDRAKEAEDRAKDKKRPPADADDPDERDDDEPGLLGIIARAFFEALFQVTFENAATLRFAAYPYSIGSRYIHNTSTWLLPEERKWVSLEIASSAATHLDGTWGVSSRAVAQLAGLHVNAYDLEIFSASEAFTVLSANAGITFFVPDFMLSAFAGAYALDALDSAHLSFGFLCQLFLPPRVHVDLFDLNAVVGDQIFSHWEATVELSLWRFALGAGWHHNVIAGTLYSGPCLRASFWL